MKTFEYENSKKLSDYEIVNSVLGRGAFGVVKAAQIKKTNELVCVKLFEKDEDILKSINSKELQLSAQMKGYNHQNLVRVLDIFDSLETEYAYLFMELCDQNLKEYCQDKKSKFTNEEMKNFMKQITDGYIYLEEHNIIHRDLKPQNILVKKEKNEVIFKLGDFGCGRIMDSTDLVKTETGTNYYQAPEIGGPGYDNKCDIYSFGIIVFEMLVGENSFTSFKNTPLLKEKSLNEIFKQELKGVDHFFVNLLNNMIVYDRLKRISWQGLRQCLISPSSKMFIHQRKYQDQNQIYDKQIDNNAQQKNNNVFQQFRDPKNAQQFVKQPPPKQFVPNIQTNFQPKQNFQNPQLVNGLKQQKQQSQKFVAQLSSRGNFFPQSEIQNCGSNTARNQGAIQGNNFFQQQPTLKNLAGPKQKFFHKGSIPLEMDL